MRRMNVIMRNEDKSSDNEEDQHSLIHPGVSGKHPCANCHAEFPNKTTADRHMLFCKTLADIRRTSGGTLSSIPSTTSDDVLLPTPREMFILIQELAAKYNKVKDELDVMKQWAKMVGRRIGGSAISAGGMNCGGTSAGLDFTSVTRQKRQNMEVILNEEDAEHPDLAELRPGFTEWLSSDTAIILTGADLNIVFHDDLVAGITSAILRVLSEHTSESGKSHLIPFKLADIKQGAFYIYDTPFKVVTDTGSNNASDLPTQKKWRAMESCEFQLLVRAFHKLLFKEFKKWQDQNWEAQQQMMKQRQKAASSYHQVMSSFQCSPAMASCDGLYMENEGWKESLIVGGVSCDDEPVTPPVTGADSILSEDFATLYNKYADKMMGGALSDDTILSRVRARLWKDMKAWRL